MTSDLGAATASPTPPIEWSAKVIMKAAHYLAAPFCIVAVEPLAKQLGPSGAMLAAAVLSLGLLLLVSYKIIAERQRDRAAELAARSV